MTNEMATELMRMNPDGTRGAIGAAITIHKATLQPELRAPLEKDGVVERLLDSATKEAKVS